MKKTMTMIVVILALGSQAIASGLSELNIRTNGNQPLKVIIDGQLVSNNATTVKIDGIPAGKHSLQVFQLLISYNSYNEEPLFFGEIFLPENTSTMALIKHHKFIIEKQFALYSPVQTAVYTYQGNQHYETKPIFWETNQHHNNVVPQVVCNMPPHIIEPNHAVEEVFPMNHQDFNNLKNAIKNQWFSDGKITVLRQALKAGNLLTTKQVTKLIDLYSFSSDRLEVAKMAYHNTVDLENYFMVHNHLEWNSSRTHLSKYIASF